MLSNRQIDALRACMRRLQGAKSACFFMISSMSTHESCRTRSQAAAAPLSRCGCLTRSRHPACARWHAFRRDTCRVGGCSALPRCCAACPAMHSGPLCLQEGASNLLLSPALARWIKVGERYPAGRPDLPFRSSPGGAPVEHSCCAGCTFAAQRACSPKREMQVGACCAHRLVLSTEASRARVARHLTRHVRLCHPRHALTHACPPAHTAPPGRRR